MHDKRRNADIHIVPGLDLLSFTLVLSPVRLSCVRTVMRLRLSRRALLCRILRRFWLVRGVWSVQLRTDWRSSAYNFTHLRLSSSSCSSRQSANHASILLDCPGGNPLVWQLLPAMAKQNDSSLVSHSEMSRCGSCHFSSASSIFPFRLAAVFQLVQHAPTSISLPLDHE